LKDFLRVKGTIEAKNLKVVLRALGFDPSNEEILNLVKGLGKENESIETTRIDFQEFLEIMIFKMVRSMRESDNILGTKGFSRRYR